MKSFTSLAVLALLSIIQKDDVVRAINIQSQLGTGLDQLQANAEQSEAYTELNRYIGSSGKPINLAQTEGHARLVLHKQKKYDSPQPLDVMNVDLGECRQQLNSENSGALDEITHCPINTPGQRVQAHIQQINLEDNAYVSEMYVGNPPQKIRALFDTGSTNTWILNKNVSLGQGVTKQYSYDDTASKTSVKFSQRAQIQFGSGALAGHFMTDDIRLGTCDGKSSGQIHIAHQKFGNVERQSTIFTGSNFEAIVGMAYPALAEKGVKPVFDEMIDQGLLQSNLFAFYLTTKQAENLGIMSDLTFGYYDKTKFQGDLVWHPIKFQYMFGVPLDDIKINGQSTGVCQNRNKQCLITFDSGTSLMSMPTFATKILMQKHIPTTNFMVPCQSQVQYGDMTLVIGGKDYTLSNDEWMFPAQQVQLSQGGQKLNFNMGPLGPQIMAQVDTSNFEQLDDKKPDSNVNAQIDIEADNSKQFKHKSKNDQTLACASTIMTMDIAQEMFLVGDVFMRKFYTVFDRDNNRVGLARAVTNERVSALQN